MRSYKDQAIIIRSHKLGESDRIITMLTSEHGLKRGVAKGVRKTTSKFGGRLEPFVHASILFHRGRNLDIITQAEVINPHQALREDFRKYLYGEALLEITMKSLQQDQQIPRLFEALSISLECLEQEVKSYELFLSAYELKVCGLIGYRPHLDQCIRCGKSELTKGAFLHLEGGGVICGHCQPSSSGGIAIDEQILRLTRLLLLSSMEEVASLETPPARARDILLLSFAYSEFYLEKPIQSHKVILGQLPPSIRKTPE